MVIGRGFVAGLVESEVSEEITKRGLFLEVLLCDVLLAGPN